MNAQFGKGSRRSGGLAPPGGRRFPISTGRTVVRRPPPSTGRKFFKILQNLAVWPGQTGVVMEPRPGLYRRPWELVQLVIILSHSFFTDKRDVTPNINGASWLVEILVYRIYDGRFRRPGERGAFYIVSPPKPSERILFLPNCGPGTLPRILAHCYWYNFFFFNGHVIFRAGAGATLYIIHGIFFSLSPPSTSFVYQINFLRIFSIF